LPFRVCVPDEDLADVTAKAEQCLEKTIYLLASLSVAFDDPVDEAEAFHRVVEIHADAARSLDNVAGVARRMLGTKLKIIHLNLFQCFIRD
jgi:hypothetical protein